MANRPTVRPDNATNKKAAHGCGRLLVPDRFDASIMLAPSVIDYFKGASSASH